MIPAALRNLDAFPIEHQGERYICLRDPEGYIENPVVLSVRDFFIASQLNGKHDLRDIQYLFAKHFGGALLFTDEIKKVVDSLDQQGLLQSERFESIRKEIENRFAATPIRSAYLAGRSYPSDPSELRSYLQQQFLREGAPGQLPSADIGHGSSLRLLIAPHIDLNRGGHSYAHGYLRLSQRRRPEIAFIFGTAHAGAPVPFVLTRKDFQTPLGILKTEQKIVDRLEEVCTWNPYEGEILHRSEHSIEFQTVFLSFLYGSDIRIVPILCGSFGNEAPGQQASIQSFLEACRKIIEDSSASITVISGADLAHVGKRFGDPFEIDSFVVQSVENRDREDLQYVIRTDAEGFYASVMKDLNKRRVCGLYNIYSSVKAIEGTGPGEVFHYGYAHDPAGGIVSFAAVAFE